MPMRRTLLLALVVTAGCKGPSAEEAATQAAVQTTDNFRFRGGVAITDHHVLTDLKLFDNVEAVSIIGAGGKNYTARVFARAKDLGLAVLFVDAGSMPHASLGEAGALSEG